MTPAISVRGVSKKYKIYPSQADRFVEAFSLGRVKRSHEFWALRDVGFDVEPGTALGILGRNGAGKSTLLKIISGVLHPTSGAVRVNGRIAALLQLGAGFNAEFTGRENVILNGLILGISRKEMLERFDEIAAFADIGEFMEQPVKTYSSGMRARLGFAVAVNVAPDVLIVDEILSVGDAVFRQMGIQKMRDLRDSGTTILFVSHSIGMVREFCSKAVLLHEGKLIASGGASETVDRYQALIGGIKARLDSKNLENEQDVPGYDIEDSSAPETGPRSVGRASLRHGNGEARIDRVELLDERLEPVETLLPGSTATIRVHLRYLKEVPRSELTVTLRNHAGLDVFSTSTSSERTPLLKRNQGERVVVDFTFKASLKQDLYSVAAAVTRLKPQKQHMDWVDVATVFKIARPEDQARIKGLIHLPARVEIHEDLDPAPRDRPA